MVTNAERPANEGETPAERIEGVARSAIAGHPQGAIRRILLYLLVIVLVISPAPLLALVPVGLLAMTDVLS